MMMMIMKATYIDNNKNEYLHDDNHEDALTFASNPLYRAFCDALKGSETHLIQTYTGF